MKSFWIQPLIVSLGVDSKLWWAKFMKNSKGKISTKDGLSSIVRFRDGVLLLKKSKYLVF
uniref:Uncharacterized protein n=1 Tax=Octopus bimaculoides TaxID=37653 RepID=A0A0L8H1S1_OCTBM